MGENRFEEGRRGEESMLDLNKMHVEEKNFLMFRKKHLFVEMHELSNSEWHETHRWNYGLEEDMKLGEWTPAHLPTISVFGMMALRDCLRPELVILDVATNEEGDSCRKLRQIAMEIVNHLVRDGQIEPGDASAALESLAAHLSLKKCVDHDAMKEKAERDRCSATAPAQSAMPRKPKRSLGSLEDAAVIEEQEEQDEDEASKTPLPRMNSLRRRRSSLKKMMSAHKLFHPTNFEKQQPHGASGTVASGIPDHLQPEEFIEDPLRPDAEEEALHVLIDNDFKELKSDAVVVVRLQVPIASEFEERFGEEKEQENRKQDLLARFIVLVLGPAKIAGSTEEIQRLFGRRHTEMGAAAAALMQDDVVVRSLYESRDSRQLLEAIDLRLSAMRIMPHTSRPTKKAVLSRASRMYQQLAELRRVAEEQARQRLKESEENHMASRMTPEVVELQNTGGKFLRLEYPDQGAKWGAREKDTFTYGLSVGAVFTFAQKYALPLLTGIILALVLANTNPSGYNRWTGVAHGDDDEEDDHDDGAGGHRNLLSRMLSGSSHDTNIPTIFGLSINDHDFTLHFLVNDVLMAFFFGLAVKEIAEAFQPGGSLYPPTKKAVNPLLGTLGGVVGPVAIYFVVLAACTSTDALSGASFSTLAKGWGIPTATDISVAWVTAVVVFGTGHPAINFLLLCAVIDDGIGLVIIAVAYSDADHPVQPIYLLLVVLAMLISYALRKMECARWQVYVALAGPIAWFGLIFANVHASLALCFVVPFMPIRIENEPTPSSQAALTSEFGDIESGGGGGGSMQKEVGHHCSPLHEFEESVKDFVDFVVLFLFGLVNAGVDLDEYGGYSLVIVAALFFGKTLGMTVGSAIAQNLGYGRPEGMTLRHLIVAGMISSVGLTVSLFIAGEAFPNDPLYEDQAKLGALLSVVPSLFFVALVNISPAGRKLLLGPPPKPMASTRQLEKPHLHVDDSSPPGDLPSVAAGLSGDGISASPRERQRNDEINYDVDYEEPEEGDEFLEDVVVNNIQKTLKEIHRIEKQVETRAGVRRSSMMLNLVHDSCLAFPQNNN